MHDVRRSFVLLAAVCIVPVALAQSADDLQGREARLLAQIRAEAASVPENLRELARVREQLGAIEQALDTWGFLKKLHGDKTALNESSAPDHTYAELAGFWVKRLQRKQNLVAQPPLQPEAELRRRLGKATRRAYSAAYGVRDGQIDLAVQADLDGDLVDELFLVGKYGPLGQRDEPFMCIAKWNGSEYEIVWRGEADERPKLFPFSFDIIDRNGDGWKEIMCGFEPETDNGATLHFNGTSALMCY